MPWLKLETPDAVFVLDPYQLTIGCRCKLHGSNCRPNRSCDKQPVGYFAAWLAVARDPAYNSRDLHFAARLDRVGDGAVLSYDNRVRYRNLWKDGPLYALLFSWEIPRGGVEPLRLR